MSRHLCSIDDLSPSARSEIFERAEAHLASPMRDPNLVGRIAGLLFYEPSTRTHLSFDSAAQRLGMGTIGFDDPSASSVSKGETLEDTIKVVQNFADCIILRHPESGAASRAAEVANVPIVNAGDGDNEHPTQTLLDMFTIRQRTGRLEGLRIGFAGDVRFGRTTHSLALAMAPSNEIVFVSPTELTASQDLIDEVRRRGALDVRLAESLGDVIAEIDVLYMTRPQRERWPQNLAGREVDALDLAMMDRMKPEASVLHPLPRTAELHMDCDSNPRAAYFQQVANGVPVRMAILEQLLGS